MAGKVFVDLGVSLDGYIAGLNAGRCNPLGDNGARIHNWVYGLKTFREQLGTGEGGEAGPDDDVLKETVSRIGANVMGRRMFDEGEANWPERAPFRGPCSSLTHAPRADWVLPGGTTFTFVQGTVSDVLDRARAAAGEKDVRISGGASTVRQFLAAGLVDELCLHVAPLLLGGGTSLFADLRIGHTGLRLARTQESPMGVLHPWSSSPAGAKSERS